MSAPSTGSGSRRVGVAPCSADADLPVHDRPGEGPTGRAMPVDREYWTRGAAPPGRRLRADQRRRRRAPRARATSRARRGHRGGSRIIGDAAHAQPPNFGQGAGPGHRQRPEAGRLRRRRAATSRRCSAPGNGTSGAAPASSSGLTTAYDLAGTWDSFAARPRRGCSTACPPSGRPPGSGSTGGAAAWTRPRPPPPRRSARRRGDRGPASRRGARRPDPARRPGRHDGRGRDRRGRRSPSGTGRSRWPGGPRTCSPRPGRQPSSSTSPGGPSCRASSTLTPTSS